MTDWILHIDLDQFLAAVEKRRRPELRDVPVIVGGEGDPTKARQVVACASYEARAFGVHAGMPLRAAHRKCPDATFLPSDAPAYDEASAEVMDTLRAFDIQLEVWGWDEAFAGATADDPYHLAARLRTAVADRTHLSCCIGIGDNKLTAKTATGLAKRAARDPSYSPAGSGHDAPDPVHQDPNRRVNRDRRVAQLTTDGWLDVMGELATDAVWGIGTKTARKLAERGVETVAQLAATDRAEMAAAFGPTIGPWLWLMGRGVGLTKITTEPRVARGRSKSVTYPRDLTDRAEIETHVTELARAVTDEVVAGGRVVTRVAVTVRTATFYTRTKISKLTEPTTDAAAVERCALAVLDRFELDRPVRLLGVRLELQ